MQRVPRDTGEEGPRDNGGRRSPYPAGDAAHEAALGALEIFSATSRPSSGGSSAAGERQPGGRVRALDIESGTGKGAPAGGAAAGDRLHPPPPLGASRSSPTSRGATRTTSFPTRRSARSLVGDEESSGDEGDEGGDEPGSQDCVWCRAGQRFGGTRILDALPCGVFGGGPSPSNRKGHGGGAGIDRGGADGGRPGPAGPSSGEPPGPGGEAAGYASLDRRLGPPPPVSTPSSSSGGGSTEAWPRGGEYWKFLGGRFTLGPDWKSLAISAFMIFVPSGLFLGLVVPPLYDRSSAAIPTISALLVTLSGIAMLRTALTDPGYIPRSPPLPEDRATDWPPTQDHEVNGYTVTTKYCSTCNHWRPPRCSHCAACDACVERFDHHCPWVGCCIGRRNYGAYLSFIGFTSLLTLWVIGCGIAVVVLESREVGLSRAARDRAAALVFAAYAFPCFWFVGGLCVFHLYLVGSNQTTYEHFRHRPQGAGNPYELGLLGNFREAWCSPWVPRPEAMGVAQRAEMERAEAASREAALAARERTLLEASRSMHPFAAPDEPHAVGNGGPATAAAVYAARKGSAASRAGRDSAGASPYTSYDREPGHLSVGTSPYASYEADADDPGALRPISALDRSGGSFALRGQAGPASASYDLGTGGGPEDPLDVGHLSTTAALGLPGLGSAPGSPAVAAASPRPPEMHLWADHGVDASAFRAAAGPPSTEPSLGAAGVLPPGSAAFSPRSSASAATGSTSQSGRPRAPLPSLWAGQPGSGSSWTELAAKIAASRTAPNSEGGSVRAATDEGGGAATAADSTPAAEGAASDGPPAEAPARGGASERTPAPAGPRWEPARAGGDAPTGAASVSPTGAAAVASAFDLPPSDASFTSSSSLARRDPLDGDSDATSDGDPDARSTYVAKSVQHYQRPFGPPVSPDTAVAARSTMVVSKRVMNARSQEFYKASLRGKKEPTFWQGLKKKMSGNFILIAFLFFIMIFSGVFSFFMYLPSEQRRMIGE